MKQLFEATITIRTIVAASSKDQVDRVVLQHREDIVSEALVDVESAPVTCLEQIKDAEWEETCIPWGEDGQKPIWQYLEDATGARGDNSGWNHDDPVRKVRDVVADLQKAIVGLSARLAAALDACDAAEKSGR